MWLTPRLPSFREAHPEIAIEFETSLLDHHAIDFERRDFDVWIAFVPRIPPALRSELLFEESLIPVCSPEFLASHGQPEHPTDLHEWPLLYDLAWRDYWAVWFVDKKAGAPDLSRAIGYRIYSMMMQSALYGMGLALGHSRLVKHYLRCGSLVELCGPPIDTPESYFVAVAPGSEDKPETQAFLEWIGKASAKCTEQLQESAAEIPPPQTAT